MVVWDFSHQQYQMLKKFIVSWFTRSVSLEWPFWPAFQTAKTKTDFLNQSIWSILIPSTFPTESKRFNPSMLNPSKRFFLIGSFGWLQLSVTFPPFQAEWLLIAKAWNFRSWFLCSWTIERVSHGDVGPYQSIRVSSWCFQPIWKICSSNWIMSLGLGWK